MLTVCVVTVWLSEGESQSHEIPPGGDDNHIPTLLIIAKVKSEPQS